MGEGDKANIACSMGLHPTNKLHSPDGAVLICPLGLCYCVWEMCTRPVSTPQKNAVDIYPLHVTPCISTHVPAWNTLPD